MMPATCSPWSLGSLAIARQSPPAGHTWSLISRPGRSSCGAKPWSMMPVITSGRLRATSSRRFQAAGKPELVSGWVRVLEAPKSQVPSTRDSARRGTAIGSTSVDIDA